MHRSARIRWPSEILAAGTFMNSARPSISVNSAQVLLVLLARDLVHVAGQVERLHDGDVPPQLRPLAEHDADAPRVLLALLGRHQAVDDEPALAGTRMPVSILMVVDLPAPLGPEVRHGLAGLDGEIDVVHGELVAILTDEEMLERPGETRFLDCLSELLGQPVGFYQRRHRMSSAPDVAVGVSWHRRGGRRVALAFGAGGVGVYFKGGRGWIILWTEIRSAGKHGG